LPLTAELPLAYVGCVPTTSVLAHTGTRQDSANRCVGQTLTFYWMTVAYVEQANSGFINYCSARRSLGLESLVLCRLSERLMGWSSPARRRGSTRFTNGSLDRKGDVSKYEIIDLKHFTK
jgi:hypothetical protein